ncbi:hypothetical protein ACFQ1Q_03825 [Winogradskyella litorisediminis]|uniref:Uncharacterized protein n=1 Tax=Winogradskyella litorisediminis TaxID=1156618 RepID=A0ABW3N403_9FLAO
MKQVILILAFLTLPIVGFAQAETSAPANTELVSIIKVEDVAPRKASTSRNAKHLKVNYKKSNDIISIKAYRKSLKDKIKRERLC